MSALSAPALLRLRLLEERRNPLTAFVAESSVHAPGVELVWEAPDLASQNRPLIILRRERRFPGRNRRGVLPMLAQAEDLSDGALVYDSRRFKFDVEEVREERQDGAIVASRLQYGRDPITDGRELRRTIRTIREPEGSVLSHTLRLLDREQIEPETIYYYTLFSGYTFNEIRDGSLLAGPMLLELAAAVNAGTAAPPFFLFSARTQAAALATRKRPARMFRSMPQVHQTLDTNRPEPGGVSNTDAGKGQLERFVETLEVQYGLSHGLVEGAADFHSPRRADSRLLDSMGHYLGWPMRDDLDEDSQRDEIMFAPRFYPTVGTAKSIAAMVNRLTNWDARVREFVRNIVVSFDARRLETLSTGQVVYLDGGITSDPPSVFAGHALPQGSLNTADPMALFRIRTHAFEDQAAYTYDTRPARSYTAADAFIAQGWFNRQTIGVYIIPDTETEGFSPRNQFDRIGQIIGEFLPIQVRSVFILQPGVIVEEEYDAATMVAEITVDRGVLVQPEDYDGALDQAVDKIPGWKFFITNLLTHRSVNTAAAINTTSRTWHVGLTPN